MSPQQLVEPDRRLLKGLIAEAFARAQRSGRPDWQTMSIAVLKNRLLTLTGGQFSEQDYGFARFSDLVRGLDDLLALDTTYTPPRATLLDPSVAAEGHDMVERLRPDLWAGLMDYRSGIRHVWDESSETVRPAAVSDQGVREFATLDESEEKEWRAEFVRRVLNEPQNAPLEPRLQTWVQRGYGTGYLPSHLRGPWNGFIREKATAHIREWFRTQGISEPADLLVSAPRGGGRARSSEPTTALREFVLSVIEQMDDAELRQLPLPAVAAFRGRRPSHDR